MTTPRSVAPFYWQVAVRCGPASAVSCRWVATRGAAWWWPRCTTDARRGVVVAPPRGKCVELKTMGLYGHSLRQKMSRDGWWGEFYFIQFCLWFVIAILKMHEAMTLSKQKYLSTHGDLPYFLICWRHHHVMKSSPRPFASGVLVSYSHLIVYYTNFASMFYFILLNLILKLKSCARK